MIAHRAVPLRRPTVFYMFIYCKCAWYLVLSTWKSE